MISGFFCSGGFCDRVFKAIVARYRKTERRAKSAPGIIARHCRYFQTAQPVVDFVACDFGHQPFAEAVLELSKSAFQICEVCRAGAVRRFGRSKLSHQFSKCAFPIFAVGLKVLQIERDRVCDGFTEFRKLFCTLSFTDQPFVVLQLRECLRGFFGFEETTVRACRCV